MGVYLFAVKHASCVRQPEVKPQFLEAAEEFAKAKEAQMAKLELDIKMVNAQATLKAAERWDGALPTQILPQGSSLLFGLDKPLGK